MLMGIGCINKDKDELQALIVKQINQSKMSFCSKLNQDAKKIGDRGVKLLCTYNLCEVKQLRLGIIYQTKDQIQLLYKE